MSHTFAFLDPRIDGRLRRELAEDVAVLELELLSKLVDSCVTEVAHITGIAEISLHAIKLSSPTGTSSASPADRGWEKGELMACS